MSNRVAFITGGASGIGAAICRAMAEAGHRVSVADISKDGAHHIARETGGLTLVFDITNPTASLNAVKETQQELGPIDILVNCAGWDDLKPFVQTDDTFMDKVIDINLKGPIRLTRLVLPSMIERSWGRIINIASDAGRVGSSLEAVYSGAKGGIIAFTKTIARETARHGITANAVCPGPTDTPLLRGMGGEGESAGKLLDALVKAVPMRRLGQPDDIAPAVVFLASEKANYITGQTLSVSGGLTMS